MYNMNTEGAKIFISYAHADEKHFQKILQHLTILRRNSEISYWHDRKIDPGADWDNIISERLKGSDIVLLLLSPDFLASSYCFDTEVEKAMELHYEGQCVVLPIVIEHCDWQNSSLGRFQALPKDGKPISSWENKDEAYLSVANGLRKLISRQTEQQAVIARNRQISTNTVKETSKFSLTQLKEAAGLEDFVEFLRDSAYHPTNLIPKISTSFYFWGHGASKWTDSVDLLDIATNRIFVNEGSVRFLVFDPRRTEEDFEERKILNSLAQLRRLQLQYHKRRKDFFQIRIYTEIPTFRLGFINHELVIVGHYRTYTSNSNESPILVFNSRENWSFYSAFRALYNEKWSNATPITDDFELLKIIESL